MGIYAFTIQEVSLDLLAATTTRIEDAGLTVTPTLVNTLTQQGTIQGKVKGFTVKFGYSWTMHGNLDIQIIQKPALASNSHVEHDVRGWFQPAKTNKTKG